MSYGVNTQDRPEHIATVTARDCGPIRLVKPAYMMPVHPEDGRSRLDRLSEEHRTLIMKAAGTVVQKMQGTHRDIAQLAHQMATDKGWTLAFADFSVPTFREDELGLPIDPEVGRDMALVTDLAAFSHFTPHYKGGLLRKRMLTGGRFEQLGVVWREDLLDGNGRAACDLLAAAGATMLGELVRPDMPDESIVQVRHFPRDTRSIAHFFVRQAALEPVIGGYGGVMALAGIAGRTIPALRDDKPGSLGLDITFHDFVHEGAVSKTHA